MPIDDTTAKYMMGYWTLSDHVLLVKFRGKPFDISVIEVYAPTTDADCDKYVMIFRVPMSHTPKNDVSLSL